MWPVRVLQVMQAFRFYNIAFLKHSTLCIPYKSVILTIPLANTVQHYGYMYYSNS